MGEIKSTLDLVMEKTKNLSLSDEEKQAQKQKEVESRVRGLLQKYLDGWLDNNQLKIEYESLKKDSGLSDDAVMINEIFSRLDPNVDNRNLLEVIAKCCRLDPAALETLLDDCRRCRREHDEAADARMAQLKEDLARTHAISGSAVVPNLETDAKWQREETALRRPGSAVVPNLETDAKWQREETALRRRFEGLLNKEKEKALQG